MSLTVPPAPSWLNDAYQVPDGAYDEATDSQNARPHWRDFFARLNRIRPESLLRRVTQVDQLLDEDGVTFGAIGEESDRQRPWKLDLIPMILSEQTWTKLESGIRQRARLYDALIKDLYSDQSLLTDGTLPPESVFAHPGFLRAAVGLHPESGKSLTLYAAELARTTDGHFRVMADRSNSPVGAGFALENRIVAKRAAPRISQNQPIRPLASFFVRLKKTLRRMSPRRVENPRIILLGSGPSNPNYFEDVYLARYLGYDLAQGTDLAVRDDQVFLKTLAGLLPVDVVLLRGRERGCDPVELGGSDPHGVPGLLQALRAGKVAIANTPGAGLIESPVFMSLTDRLCQRLLGETLELPSIGTWWCNDPRSLEYVLDNMESLVIKPAFAASGSREFIAAHLGAVERDELRSQIQLRPYDYVAQELVTRSAAPMVSPEAHLVPSHVAIRLFAVADKGDYSVMPGGLVRVSRSSGPMKLSISGGECSKDLWVRSTGPLEQVTLLPPGNRTLPLTRTTALFPSRVADDLFWLGRSIDRADVLCRQVRALVGRLSAESEVVSPDTQMLVRAAIEIGQLEPGFAVGELAAGLPELVDAIPTIITDISEPNGLGSAVSEITRLSSLVRDWISPETWHQLHVTSHAFLAGGPNEQPDLGDTAATLDALVLSLATGMGLIDNGMIRSPAWRFLDLGRRIERATILARFLTSLLQSELVSDVAVLRMVLEVLDCQMTYRARYLDDVQQNAVLDLGITDSTNPRSLESLFSQIVEHVDALPDDTQSVLRSDEKRLAMSAVHSVRMLTSDELGDPNPEVLLSVLKKADQDLQSLSAVLQRKYLLHSGEPRQIVVERRAVT